jgi:hypothetical protein
MRLAMKGVDPRGKPHVLLDEIDPFPLYEQSWVDSPCYSLASDGREGSLTMCVASLHAHPINRLRGQCIHRYAVARKFCVMPEASAFGDYSWN